jgi:hypothetical protein
MTEEGEILIEKADMDLSNIIAQQLAVIDEVYQLPDDAYDSASEDKVKVISRAFVVIHKAQLLLIKSL